MNESEITGGVLWPEGMAINPEWRDWHDRLTALVANPDMVGTRYDNGHTYAIMRSGELVPYPERPTGPKWIEDDDDRQ